jgi:WD40 repeat protein
MSSDLRDLFKRDLNEIPVPEPGAWTAEVRRRREAPRVARWLVVGVVIVAVVVASLGAGQFLVAIRERLAGSSAATSALPAFRAGNDLLYLAESDLARGGTQIVDMPGGSLITRFSGRGVVGSYIDRFVMRTGPDIALLATVQDGARPEAANTYLQAVVLHTGVPTFRIDTGGVATGPTVPPGAVQIAGFHVGEVALSSDGSRAYFVRDEGPTGATTRLIAYDARHDANTNAPTATNGNIIATRTWSGPDASWARTWARVLVLDAGHVALVRQRVQGADLLGRATRIGQEWHFLDADLNEIASYTVAASGGCSFDLIRVPNDAWAMICADQSGAAQTWSVRFLRAADFAVIADVAVARELGSPLGGAVAADGTLRILTNRPAVVSINTRTHQVIGKEPVTERHSLLELFTASVAFGKDEGSPGLQFSPDGRFAYLTSDRSLWWGGIALIDLEKATLVTHTTAVGSAYALRLSPNGDRLYALVVGWQEGTSDLVLLDPGTLAEVARSVTLSNGPSVIIAVAEKR